MNDQISKSFATDPPVAPSRLDSHPRHHGWRAPARTLLATCLASALGATAVASAQEEGFRVSENTTVKIGGYIKLDAIHSTSSDGPIPSIGRHFYFPPAIPVGGGESRRYTDFTSRETRFNITSLTQLDTNTIRGFVELDFYGTDGDARISNNYAPRLRHAYIEVNDTWLLGQAFSNFMDLGTFPETLDAQASAESIYFARAPQIRYTNRTWMPGTLSVSIESPYNSFDSSSDMPLGETVDQSGFPEATFRYQHPTTFGYLDVGGLIKQVSTDNLAPDNDNRFSSDSTIGYGARLSGAINLGDRGDTLGFSVTYGDGIGRYLGLGAVSEGYIDANGNIRTIPYLGTYVYLRHYWNPKWRSNFVAGTLRVDNDTEQDPFASSKTINSIHANLLWNPLRPLILGMEYVYADREVETGDKGHINRLQFSAKYSF